MDTLSRAEPDGSGQSGKLLIPGRNCWRIERANRLAVIVDAADYFAAVKSSIEKAQRTVLLIGWDFDTRIHLDPDQRKTTSPDKLSKFLTWVVEQRPELQVYMLKWDLGIVDSLGRGSTPLVVLDWITDRRMHFKLDHAHPPAAAHHQKIVVIDDSLAYCGGIDITADRWDTREHLDDNPHRRRPTTHRKFPPWHDATTAVDGDLARALGELARQRWKRATGEDLASPNPVGDPWPDDVRPTFENVAVAIARTLPLHKEQKEVREIEALYLSAIGRARRSVYIESQYFASRRIGEAIVARLEEKDGPEFVILNPASAIGWLEGAVMGGSRERLLRLIRGVDRHKRFRMYTPVTESGQPIYVHAKIMVVDDWLLRVGSSNLNNRSMGYDTECDLAVEAPQGEAGNAVRQAITAFRDDLLAEHLGVKSEEVAAAAEACGHSLVATIEGLRKAGRTLQPFAEPDYGILGEALAENELLDPEGIATRRGKLGRWVGALKGRLQLARGFGRGAAT